METNDIAGVVGKLIGCREGLNRYIEGISPENPENPSEVDRLNDDAWFLGLIADNLDAAIGSLRRLNGVASSNGGAS